MALPTTLREFEKFYTLTPTDREFVAARRTATNRLGIAVQRCFLRHPGRVWIPKEAVPLGTLHYIASQIEVTTSNFGSYADRDETRREHLADLLVELGLSNTRQLRLLLAKGYRSGTPETASPGSPQVVPIPTSP